VLGSPATARVLAAAARMAEQRSGPITGAALAGRANVSQHTVSRVREEIQRRFPGVLGSPAKARVLAAAGRIAADQSGPVTGTELAAQAKVSQDQVSRLRREILERFPGVLGSARERLLAAAHQVAAKGSGPVTGVTLATRANVDVCTMSRLRDEIHREFPGVLVS
jgi:transcriptional regulator GlxA family with amidase domain